MKYKVLYEIIMTFLTSLMKALTQKLSSVFNLSTYEAKVFMALSGFEKAHISQIARASSIARTAVYPSVKSLLEKGLISVVLAGGRKHYKALTPPQLQSMFEWKKRDMAFVVGELIKNVPASEEQMEFLYFPGRNGLNTAAEVFLRDSKGMMWRTFENSVVNQPALEFYQLEDYIDRRVKKGIHGKVIMTLNMMYPFLKERLDRDKEELRETILVPDKLFPFKVVVGINEDSVLLLSGEEFVFGAVIKNTQFAQTLATLHEMIWTRYKN